VTEGNNTYSYTYNWDGLRASKTVNGVTTNHIWDGDQMVLETDAAGNVTNKYVRGINLIYSGEGANRRYFLYNGHGDTVQLTGTTGSSIKAYDYDAFGVEKNIDPEDTNLFRYCGEYFDKETGTIYLRARYYDPTIGRFITEDSYWGEDSDPLSLNLYTYCGNNPIGYIDPSGHWTLSQYDNLGSGMYARLKEEGINILQLNPVSMLMNSYKQWKALLNNDITVAEVYAAGFESIISDYKYVLDGKNNFVKAYMPLKSGASDKEVYNAGYHIAGIIIDLATAGVAVDDIVKAVRANRAAIKATGELKNHSGIVGKNGSLATKGTPNSSVNLYSKDGVLLQRRYYGSDGRALKDIDFTHGGNHKFPHTHLWDWSSGKGIRK